MQDFNTRKMNMLTSKPSFVEFVNKNVALQYPECAGFDFAKGAKNDCLLMDELTAYQLDNPRIGVLESKNYKKVLVSKYPIYGWRGWRVSQPPADFDATLLAYDANAKLPIRTLR